MNFKIDSWMGVVVIVALAIACVFILRGGQAEGHAKSGGASYDVSVKTPESSTRTGR